MKSIYSKSIYKKINLSIYLYSHFFGGKTAELTTLLSTVINLPLRCNYVKTHTHRSWERYRGRGSEGVSERERYSLSSIIEISTPKGSSLEFPGDLWKTNEFHLFFYCDLIYPAIYLR